jgi:hypothetical protein
MVKAAHLANSRLGFDLKIKSRKAEISAETTSPKRRVLPAALRAYSWKKG